MRQTHEEAVLEPVPGGYLTGRGSELLIDWGGLVKSCQISMEPAGVVERWA